MRGGGWAAEYSRGEEGSDSVQRVVALLYDVHGNLPALEAVLEDASGARDAMRASTSCLSRIRGTSARPA